MTILKKILLILAIIAIAITLAAGCFLFNGPNSENENQACIKNKCYGVEIAKTPDERERGLMFRENLDQDNGMLFVFDRDGAHPFWMKNTLISLDIVWIGADKKIVFISENTPPCAADPCPSIYPDQNARYVLEINAGQIKKIGAKIGDPVVIE